MEYDQLKSAVYKADDIERVCESLKATNNLQVVIGNTFCQIPLPLHERVAFCELLTSKLRLQQAELIKEIHELTKP